MNLPNRAIIAVVDPVCSWCWGFGGVLEELRHRYEKSVSFVAIMGGLRPGPAAEPLRGIHDFLRSHWREVHTRTGQPIDEAFIDRDGDLVLDTEIPCRAVVAARRINPDSALPMYHATQRALFAQNRNVFEAQELARIAGEIGLDPEAFEASFDTEAVCTETAADFQLARSFGVAGFPTLLVRDDEQFGVVTRGYAPLERVDPVLAALRPYVPVNSAPRARSQSP